jgi:PAS domain S-box-containing protein
MKRPIARVSARAFAQPVTYLGLAILAFIYCALAYLLISDRHNALLEAKSRADNLVRVLEQSFSHAFVSIDAALLFLRQSYRQDPSSFDIKTWAHRSSLANELVFDFVVADANGTLLTMNNRARPGAIVADRDYFLAHATSSTDELFIGQPIVTRGSGLRAFTLSRRVTAPDGGFAGIVAAFVDPAQLAKKMGAIDLGPDGTFILVGFDAVVRTRAVNGQIDWASVGRNIPSLGIIQRFRQAPTGTFWNVPGPLEMVSRLISYRVLESFPMVAAVSISETEVYRRANENALMYWTIALLLTVGIVAAIALGAWREQRLLDTTAKMEGTQAALQQSQERYRLIESAVWEGIWDVNVLTGAVYRSPRWKNILAYGDDEPFDAVSSFFQIIHPDDRAGVAEAYRAHLENDTPYAPEFRLRSKSGEYRWVQSRGKALRDADGRAVRMVGTITDVTERKRAEALLEESRNNLARAEAMALLGNYRWETGSDRFVWSDGVYRIMGKTRDSFIPTPSAVLALVHPEDRPLLEHHRAEAWAGREPPLLTLRVVMDDGTIKYVEGSSMPTRAADGTVTGLFGALQDVTARKQAEEALERINHDLEQRVAERTAALAQEMRRREEAQMTLAHMQKMEVVGQLTAGIAHDFNNLLAVIGGGLEFIAKSASEGVTAEQELIDASLRATRRGRDLVQRLLAFARQSPLNAEPTRINQLVLDTMRLLQRTLGEGIDIVTQLDATAAIVCVDRNQLANALVNLALNARDAMPQGGVLSIATVAQPARWAVKEGSARWPTGDEVCITVSDTGGGMTDEVRTRAFEPFFTTKRDGLGSGLGLSIVQGFVEQSGGHIEIDSEPGRGTSIAIRLPRIEATMQTEDISAIVGGAVDRPDKTVLLVEDDPDVRTVTAALLKQLGYKVHAVANGAEAIDVIGSPASIDITLTDIVLPGGIDGVALLKEAMRSRPRMGVLCMSGYNPTQEHRKWLKVQNIEFLEKPFSSGRLAQALDAVLVR